MSVRLEYSYKDGVYLFFNGGLFFILYPEDMKYLSKRLKEEGY